MIDFLPRLGPRKPVQQSMAYLAAAFAVNRAVDAVAAYLDRSPSVVR